MSGPRFPGKAVRHPRNAASSYVRYVYYNGEPSVSVVVSHLNPKKHFGSPSRKGDKKGIYFEPSHPCAVSRVCHSRRDHVLPSLERRYASSSASNLPDAEERIHAVVRADRPADADLSGHGFSSSANGRALH